MSRSSRRAEEGTRGPDGAWPTAPMRLSGVVRTSHGYAVCSVTLRADGSLEAMTLGRSQKFKQYVAAEHKRFSLAEALKA